MDIYSIAWSAGLDAGNRSMRKAGRNKWTDDDYSKAVETMEKLLTPDIVSVTIELVGNGTVGTDT